MNITAIFQGLAAVLWLLGVGSIVLTVARAGQGRPLRNIVPVIIVLLVAAVAMTIVSAGLVFIEPDERGVIISPYDPDGFKSAALGPGLHWIIPGERVARYSISRQTYTMSVAPSEGAVQGDDSIRARTKDGQEVYIDASVIYQIDPAQVVNLHIIWQNRYEDGVVRAISRGIIRDAASQYGVEEIVSSKRTELEGYISDQLTNHLKSNSLMLVQFVLRDIHFSDEYASAVEQKQIAEQQAMQAENIVKQKEQEARQAVATAKGQADAAIEAARGEAESVKINAEGAASARLTQAAAEAKALEMIAAALQDNPDLLTYQYITKLSPNVEVMYLPTGQPYILQLPQP